MVCAALALAACQTVPPAPLMSPLAPGQSYGYSATGLGDDRYQVTYVGPAARSLSSLASREKAGIAGRTQAYDFALWRAAQIALARGFPGFRVGNVHSNVNSYDDQSYGPWGPPWYGPGYPFHRWWGGPWPYGDPYWGPSPYAYNQAQVTLDVTLLHSPGPGDYDAKSVIAQLRRTYPGAEDGTATAQSG